MILGLTIAGAILFFVAGIALGRRGPRKPVAPRAVAKGSTTDDSLANAIDGYDRAAVADTLGFPLAARGDDGQALAAFGALVFEAATRAASLTSTGKPVSIEIVDEHGVHAAVHPFDVAGADRDRMLLVTVAPTPLDAVAVAATVGHVSAILAPGS